MQLLCAVVIAAVLVASIGLTQMSQRVAVKDQTGQTVLNLARTEGRAVAAANGNTYPTSGELLTALWETETTVSTNAAGAAVQYTAGVSYAPKSQRNDTTSFVVSTATDGAGRAAYAVETTADGSMGHCWTLVDNVKATDTESATWAFSKSTPVGDCQAELIIECASSVTGTQGSPSTMPAAGSCEVDDVDVPTDVLGSPSCFLVTSPAAGQVQFKWKKLADSSVTGYRILVFPKDLDVSLMAESAAYKVIDAGAGVPSGGDQLEFVYEPAADASPVKLASGAKYTFAAVATLASGGTTSVADLAATQALPVWSTTPDVPASIAVEANVADREIAVSWNGPEAADEFLIERSVNGGAYTDLTVVAADKAPGARYNHIDTGLMADTKYAYRLTSRTNAADQNVCGNIITHEGSSATATSPDLTLALLPPLLEAKAAVEGALAAVLSWGPVGDNEISYALRKTGSDLTWTVTGEDGDYKIVARKAGDVVGVTNSPTLAVTDSAVRAGRSYDYQVTAQTRGMTAESNIETVSFAKPTAASAVTVDVTAVATGVGVNKIDWAVSDASTNTTKWTITRADGGAAWKVTGAPFAWVVTQTVGGSGASNQGGVYPYVQDNGAGTSTKHTYTVTATDDPALTGKGTALQYPGNPSVTVTGSDANGDGIAEAANIGKNTVTWAAVPNAASYEVRIYNVTVASGAISGTLTRNTTTTATVPAPTLKWVHNAVPRGTLQYYTVVAANATGTSSNDLSTQGTTARTNAKGAYQLPQAPGIATRPNASLNNRNLTAALTAVGDAGQAAGAKFCGVAEAKCKYTIERGNGTVEGTRPTAGAISWTQDWGVTRTYRAEACNAGGCAVTAIGDIDSYPGPFSLSFSQQAEDRVMRVNSGNPKGSAEGANAWMEATWTAAEGSGMTYKWNRTGTDRARGWQNNGTKRSWKEDVTANIVYGINVTAIAGNGTSRQLSTTFQTKPPAVTMISDVKYCKPETVNKPGDKAAYRFYRAGTRRGGTIITGGTIDTTWAAGLRSAGASGDDMHYGRTQAMNKFGAPDNDPATWKAPQNWTAGLQYNSSESVSANNTLSGIKYVGGNNTTNLISDKSSRYQSAAVRYTVPKTAAYGSGTGEWSFLSIDVPDNYKPNCSGSGWTIITSSQDQTGGIDRVAAADEKCYVRNPKVWGWNAGRTGC